MEWQVKSLGNAEGTAECGAGTVEVQRIRAAREFVVPEEGFSLHCTRGKLADSEDSFLFCYRKIRPDKENFILSARFTVTGTEEKAAAWQAGYGIFALDTAESGSLASRHRNMMAVGRFRMREPRICESGVRLVDGYTRADACGYDEKRTLDSSRTASFSNGEPLIRTGESYWFCLEKTDEGLKAAIRYMDQEQSFFIPGCDFLTRQDPDSIAVGFAVARDLKVKIEDISFTVSSGRISKTPADTIRLCIPDYPFSRSYPVPELAPETRLPPGDVFVSPYGKRSGKGFPWDPVDLQTALETADQDHAVVLMDGIYRPESPYYIAENRKGTDKNPIRLTAFHPGKAVIDGSGLQAELPVFILRGENWHLTGMIFRNSPNAGLFICGDSNTVELCEAYENRDTGILICAYPGSGHRPAGNRVLNCDSHDNRDGSLENADGFGAKLSAGEGNVFEGCIAHHNIDDGFDLYTKSVLGPIGAVSIRNCVAYSNGILTDGRTNTGGHGIGFKLGGEGQAVPHQVKNCVAYGNREAGFASNQNPSVRLEHVTAWENGKTPELFNIRLRSLQSVPEPDWSVVDSLPEKVYIEVGSNAGVLSVPNAENSGTERAEREKRKEIIRRELFSRADVSLKPSRKKNGNIELQDLFE